MAKAKRTRVKRAKKVRVRSMPTNRPKSQPVNRVSTMVSNADAAVRNYVSLLKNPCAGPLIGPVGASNGGYITRFEKTFTVADQTGETAFALRYTPGLLTTNGVATTGLLVQCSTSDTGALTVRKDDGDAPGFSYLSNTAINYRCLAACAQVSYLGSEVNRAGMIGSGLGTGVRTFANVAELFSISSDRARVPDQRLEVLWEPNEGDLVYTPVQSATQAEEVRARKNAILLSGVLVPNQTIQIRLVVVYQWTPQSDDGIILNNELPGTGHTLSTVLRYARGAGFIAGHLLKSYAAGGLMGVAREIALNVLPSKRSMR